MRSTRRHGEGYTKRTSIFGYFTIIIFLRKSPACCRVGMLLKISLAESLYCPPSTCHPTFHKSPASCVYEPIASRWRSLRNAPGQSDCVLAVTLPRRFQLIDHDFNVTDCCTQRSRLGADCAAGNRQQFVTDFRAGPGNLVILYRPMDQVERSQVVHRCFRSTWSLIVAPSGMSGL